MEGNGLGPFSDVETFIVGDHTSAINHLLAQGWRILNVSFVLDERGRFGTPEYSKQYIPYAAMGRAIAEGEIADVVRRDAIEYSQAQQPTLRDDAVPALVDDEPEPELVARKPRRAANPIALSPDHP